MASAPRQWMGWRVLAAAVVLTAVQPAVAVGAATTAAPAVPTAPAADPFANVSFRSLGPAVGGRVSEVAGVPGDPRTYYAATSQGGVWKSENGGLDWRPLFDQQPVASIGSIAVSPADPNLVWVGSGEANIRGNVIPGQGIFRSTDAGKSFRHVWKQQGQIGAIVAHPHDPDVAFAAVLGHAFGPNPERGVYRTRDGGESWQRVLFVDADTGASDVALDPNNPRIVFAGTWQARRSPWGLTSGGPGGGLWRSLDGGDTWARLAGSGLPTGLWGKVGVAVAPSDSRRVYALIEAGRETLPAGAAETGGLYRSDDGGDTWTLANAHHALTQRAWYYATITVDPTNADRVWFPQVPLLRTLDGGRTLDSVAGTHHADHHDLWIDPRDPRRMIIATDGGVEITLDGGATWHWPRMAIGQFYNVDADQRTPYHVGGTMQDFGTASGPVDSLRWGGLTVADWQIAGGGEAGDFVYDRGTPGVVYAGEYGGILTTWEEETGWSRNVSAYPTNPSGHGAVDLRVRFQWTAPIAVSPHDPNELYHAANVLFRSRDRGQTWETISPDLTRDDESKQQWSGGPITGDNTTVEIYGTIFSLALSPHAAGTIWAGSDDGLLHVTRDAGQSWSRVTPPGAPKWGTVEAIEVSPHQPDTVWVVYEAYRLDDPRPHLFRTRDGGRSWQALGARLPADQPLFVVREDPVVPGLLYAGTERGLQLSRDGGDSWQPLRGNLPTVKVTDLVVHRGDLVVATGGRSLWILDDLGAVRGLDPAATAKPLHVFPPRPAVRWMLGGHRSQDGETPNPPRGAILDYWLGAEVAGEVVLEVRDAAGALVRRLTSTPTQPEYGPTDPDEPGRPGEPALATKAGLHRVVWDLRHAGAARLERVKIDLGDPTVGPLVSPGIYELTLRAGSQVATARVEVVADPRRVLPAETYAAQLAATLAVRDRLDQVGAMIRRVRAIAAQADDLVARLGGAPAAGATTSAGALAGAGEVQPAAGGEPKPSAAAADADALVTAARALATAARALEAKLHNPRAQVVYDILAQRGGTQLHSDLAFLYSTLLDADAPPAQGAREVDVELVSRQIALGAELSALEGGLLAEVERLAAERRLPRLVLPPLRPPAR
jgi:photosystem II stability/assembly factor-like uncharacterized protein